MTAPPSTTLPSPVAPSPTLTRRKRGLAALRWDRCGVAALEMAIIAPVLLTASLGLYSVVQAVRVKLLLNTAASSMALLVASQDKIVVGIGGNLSDFCSNGASNSLLPYNPKPVAMTVARYSRPPKGSVSAPDWQRSDVCKTTSTAVMGATEATLVNTLITGDGDTTPAVIVVKATYLFNSTISTFVPSFTISTTRYEKARNVGKAACANC